MLGLLVNCGRPEEVAQGLEATPASSGAPTIGPLRTPTPSATPTISFFDPELDPGPTPTFSPAELTTIAEAEADLQEERDYRATMHALPPGPVDEPFPQTTPIPVPTMPTGIRSFDTCGGGTREELHFWVINCWTVYTEPGTLTVYAGFDLPIPADGLVLGGTYVVTNTLDRMTPVQSAVYGMPVRVGGVEIVQADGLRLTLRADDGSHWIFDVTTRTWEQAPAAGTQSVPVAADQVGAATGRSATIASATTVPGCELYALALPHTAVANIAVGQEVELAMTGNVRDAVGWVTWDGDQSMMSLSASLTPPGTSTLYRNPRDPNDRTVSVGDWVAGRAITRAQTVSPDTLAQFVGRPLTVPVWRQAQGADSRLQYQIDAFVQVEHVTYDLIQNQLTVRYLGPAACG